MKPAGVAIEQALRGRGGGVSGGAWSRSQPANKSGGRVAYVGFLGRVTLVVVAVPSSSRVLPIHDRDAGAALWPPPDRPALWPALRNATPLRDPRLQRQRSTRPELLRTEPSRVLGRGRRWATSRPRGAGGEDPGPDRPGLGVGQTLLLGHRSVPSMRGDLGPLTSKPWTSVSPSLRGDFS